VYVCDLTPEVSDGAIAEYSPQQRYRNKNNLALHKNGKGSFCRFRIPGNARSCGVYIITVGMAPQYVGECRNLSARFNTGYGQISPRNCFVGGQETNCHINARILSEAKVGNRISLWFLTTESYKATEKKLRTAFRWNWNRA
jgi:hypothetical protein